MYQQAGCVDVDAFNEGELLLDLGGGGPGPQQLDLHPVTDAAVFALEGGGQGVLWKLEAEGELMSACRESGGPPVI